MDAISRITERPTDIAEQRLRETLLKLPRDYVEEIRKEVSTQQLTPSIEPIISFGHSVRDHLSLIEEHEIDLLVLNTEDHHVRTMSDIAYGLTIECREIPILLLCPRG